MAQGQVLEGKLAVAAEQEGEDSKQVEQEKDHRVGIVSGSESTDQPHACRPRFWRRTPGPGHVPVDTGMAPVAAGLDQAALTSIIIGVTARGAGTLTSSMPFAYFASTSAASTPSGSPK